MQWTVEMNSSYYAAAESDAQCDFGIYLHTHKAKRFFTKGNKIWHDYSTQDVKVFRFKEN